MELGHACRSPRAHFLAHRPISITHAVRRQNELPNTDVTATECSGALEQVIFPHPAEPLTVPGGHLGSVGLELLVPGHKGPIIENTKIVNVLHDEQTLDGGGDLAHGR